MFLLFAELNINKFINEIIYYFSPFISFAGGIVGLITLFIGLRGGRNAYIYYRSTLNVGVLAIGINLIYLYFWVKDFLY